MIKWTYKECIVEVSAMPDSLAFKPVVEINSKTCGIHTIMAPRRSFPSVKLAEQRGVEIAREWIEENSGDSS